MRSLKRFAFPFALPLLLCTVPAHAQFGFKLPKGLKFPGVSNLDPQTFLTQRLGDALGAGSPLLLDQSTAWEQTDAPGGFKPVPVSGDFAKPLAPGDYALPVIFYCTQWSIHRPGRGVPYKMGRAQGTQAKAISAFLYRGTIRGLAPSTLNADAWRVQAGVPLSQWPAPDQQLVQQLVPEYADSLQGDFFHKIEIDYDHSFRLVTRKSFTDMLQSMGDMGHAALRLQQARTTLSNQTLAADHLPEMLYEQTGDGTPLQGPPDPDHPSPWMQMGAGVVGRFTDQDGNLGRNLFEFRVAPSASPSVSDIFNGTEDDAGRGIVGYPIGQGAQDPVIEPVPPNIQSIALQPKPGSVPVGAAITGTAIPEDSSGKKVDGLSVTITFRENGKDLGSTTASGGDYAFSFQAPDAAGTVQIQAAVSTGSTPQNPDIQNPDSGAPQAQAAASGTISAVGSVAVTDKGSSLTVMACVPSTAAVQDRVTITGSGFTGATQVKFNAMPSRFHVVSDTQIQAVVPFYADFDGASNTPAYSDAVTIAVTGANSCATGPNLLTLRLSPSLLLDAKTFTSVQEGTYYYAYRDTTDSGFVTLGVGHNTDAKNDLQTLDFRRVAIPTPPAAIAKNPGKGKKAKKTRSASLLGNVPAPSRAPVAMDAPMQAYDAKLHAASFGAGHSAAGFESLSEFTEQSLEGKTLHFALRLTAQTVRFLFDADYATHVKISELKDAIAGFDGLPEDAQIATMDIAFNPGRGSFKDLWPNYINALNSNPPEWDNAIGQSTRQDLGKRNNAVKAKLTSARDLAAAEAKAVGPQSSL